MMPFATLSTYTPLAWFLATAPVFIATLRQKPDSRWWMLPLNVLPAVQSYRTVGRLSTTLPGLDWLLAFTTLIYVFHATSALYIEQWVLPRSQKSTETTWLHRDWLISALRAWMNPRRLRLTAGVQAATVAKSRDTMCSPASNATAAERAVFFGKRIATLAILGLIYVAIELGILLVLLPGPRDFGGVSQTYFPTISWSSPDTPLSFGASPTGELTRRVAALRAVYALHWAWLTYLILTAAHTVLAVAFVCVLRIDTPAEWPPLFGSALDAFTLRRFWGRFWHQLGTPSMLAHGRVVTRKILRLKSGGATEKAVLAMWVFATSGLIHTLVTRKTDEVVDAGGGVPWLSSDWWFLMLNFAAGLAEAVLGSVLPAAGEGRRATASRLRVALCVLGYFWVFAFFWCTVPPYQYPVLERAALRRLPFKVNLSSSTTLNSNVRAS